MKTVTRNTIAFMTALTLSAAPLTAFAAEFEASESEKTTMTFTESTEVIYSADDEATIDTSDPFMEETNSLEEDNVITDECITEVYYASTTLKKKLIEDIGNYAASTYSEHKILPSLTVAQFILESSSNKRESGISKLAEEHYNYFGMKAGSSWKGDRVNCKTFEYTKAGEKYDTSAYFRAYSSLEEGMKGYYEFLQYPRYSNLKNVKDYKTACKLIREDGWATAPSYTDSLISIIESNNLTRFDKSISKVMTGLSLASAPTKTTYWIYENNPIQTSGLSLKVSYSDGSSKTVTSGFTIEKVPDMSHEGSVPVTISYTENSVKKTVSYNITLKHPFKGSGSESDPYLIESSADLVRLAKVINGKYVTDAGNKAGYNYLYYRQTADIDMTGIDFTPIGIFYSDLEHTTNADLVSENTFDGIYDGDGHSIDNLSVNYKYNYAGLFGRINSSAVIRNLSVKGNIISDKMSCGGIVGEAGYGGLIENSSFSGIVSGSDFVGGICGKLHRGGTISDCSVTDSRIVSLNYVGIIAGYAVTGDHNKAADITISHCSYSESMSLPVSEILGGQKNDTVKENYITVSDNNSNDAKYVSGDINNDGCIDITDLSKLAIALVDKYEFTPEDVLRGDLDGDGSVGLTDLAVLRQFLSKVIESI